MEKRTVLFVDDETKVLMSLKRGLMDEPYETLFAKSAKDALEILQQKQVHVIITDMRMPKMSGLELLKIVKREYPYIIRLVLSGYAELNNVLDAINQGDIFRFITKPWKLEVELKTVIRQAIEYYDLHSEREMLMNFLEQLAEGTDPEKLNLRLIQTLISMRKRHLYEWSEKCNLVPQDSH
jgi:two-component system response regulator HupR/HoxA